MDYSGMLRLAGTALAEGADRLTQSHIEWDVAGNCHAPVGIELHVRPDAWAFQSRPEGFPLDWWDAFKKAGLIQKELRSKGFAYDGHASSHPIWLTLMTRCRRCKACLRARAMKWRNAALCELERSSRTWFCTFTLREDEQWLNTCRASEAARKRSVVFSDLSPGDQFRESVRAFGPSLTRYLKRVRKNSGAKMRYLLVAEAHKSGLPHFHALLHEMDPARPLRKRCIEDAWGYGFTNVKLVNDQAPAWYVCKYLTKDVATRVRSSLHYGKTETV